MAHDPTTVEAYADAAAAALGIPLTPERRPGVLGHLSAMFVMGDRFIDQAIDEETEPAPVFRA